MTLHQLSLRQYGEIYHLLIPKTEFSFMMYSPIDLSIPQFIANLILKFQKDSYSRVEIHNERGYLFEIKLAPKIYASIFKKIVKLSQLDIVYEIFKKSPHAELAFLKVPITKHTIKPQLLSQWDSTLESLNLDYSTENLILNTHAQYRESALKSLKILI